MLHITNGESAANGIQHAGIPGAVLAWVDVLHEGPTPASLSLEQMSQVRARFIAAFYALPFEELCVTLYAEIGRLPDFTIMTR